MARRLKTLSFGAVLCLLTWLALTQVSLTQIKSGAVVGLVTDPSGAVIPDAHVSVVNEETNVAVDVTTNQAGEYTMPYLPPGRYTVTVKREGFSVFKQTGIALGSAEGLRVNAQLQVGSEGTTVEVKAEVANLQTESTSVQGRIEDRIIKSIPNINNNPYYFATLQPSVVGRNPLLDTSSPDSFGIGVSSRTNFSAFTINGGLAFTNDLTLDGVSIMSAQANEAGVLVNQDAIQEVRVITNNFSAEYGRGQGVVSIITKSGTNQYHGSIFDRLRNEALNANTFQNNALGIPKGPFKVNSFGGTFGGPIKKDKAFFFVSYEGLLHHDAADWLATVPTPLEKQGNFSQTLVNLNGVPAPVRLFNPFQVTQVGPNLYQRAEIPNATIQNPDPFALKLYSFYPDPNRPPTDVYNSNNYFHREIRPFRKDSFNGRVDYHRGMHSVYAAGGIEHGTIKIPGGPWGADNPFYVPPSNFWTAPQIADKNPYAAIGDTLILSPTLLVDFRLGVHRINTIFGARSTPNFDYDAIGIPPSIQNIFALPGSAPDLLTSRWTNLGRTESLQKHEHQTNYDLVGSMTKVLGKWTLKAGVEFRVDHSNYQDPEEGAARYDYPGWCTTCGTSFTSQFVTATGNNTAQDTTPMISGLDDASLLLGAGAFYVAPGRSIRPALAEKYLGLYTQNDWHVSPRLTVNLGLRWDLQPGPTERYNQASSFDFTKTNPFGSPGAVAFPGTDGYSRNLWDAHYRDFGPRVGVAYRLSETLVVRGGYGITYIPGNTGFFDGPYNYGVGSFGAFTSQLPYGTNPHGIPIGSFHGSGVTLAVQGTGTDPAAPQLYGTGDLSLFDRHNYLNGKVMQWNSFLEKRLGSNWMVSLGYSASRGDHLPVTRFPLNNLGLLSQPIKDCYRSGINCPAQDGDLNSKGYINTGSDPAFDPVPNPFNPNGTLPFNGSLAASTIPRYLGDSRYPLFEFAGVQRSFGFSNYQSMIVEVKHGFANGLQLDAHYTWSKSLDFTHSEAQFNDGTNNPDPIGDLQNLHNNKKLSITDIPHRFVLILLYELPFGAGKHFDSQSRVLNHVISGWRVGAVNIIQSGFPARIDGAASGALNRRPFRVPGEPLEVPQSLQHWYDGKTTVTLPDGRQITPCANCFLKYNPDAFAGSYIPDPNNPGKFISDAYWLGDAALDYGGFRSPRRNNLDMSIGRTFKATERLSVEFLANFTNFLNHAQFQAYSAGLGGINVTPNDPTQTKLGQPTGSSGFGTHGLGTYDPRQVEFQLRIRF